MNKRTYLWFLLICVLLGSGYAWLQPQKDSAATIPSQAIRLRILANSDSAQDQWLKRKVRDRVVQEIRTWSQQPKNITEARQLIRQHLPRLQQLSEQTVAQYGYRYPVQLQFGKVPFPTKLYGEKLYPAGIYEALVIKIGRAEGDNWWCVLFPPLCFVDMKNGDAVPSEPAANTFSTPQPHNHVYAAERKQQQQQKVAKPEVRFLLYDLLQNR